MILLHVPKVLVQILVSVCICLARGFVDSRVVLQLWNRRGVGRDNWTNQTRNPNIPTVKRLEQTDLRTHRWTQRDQRAQTPPAREHHGNGGPVGSKPPMCRPDAWGGTAACRLPEELDGDGYESRKLVRELKRRHGWRLQSPNAGSATWIVERTFAWLSQKSSLEQRLQVEGPKLRKPFIDLAAIRLMLKWLAPR